MIEGKRSDRWLKWLAMAAGVNVGAYILPSMMLGGFSFAGKIVAGHYFFGFRGSFTEVSQATYLFNLWHGISVPTGIVPFVAWMRRNAR